MIKSWSDDAWTDYMYWHDHADKYMVKRINRLIKAIDRTPFTGIGKPEPLKHDLTGKWSRHITQEHRIVYSIVGTNAGKTIQIYSCRDHY